MMQPFPKRVTSLNLILNSNTQNDKFKSLIPKCINLQEIFVIISKETKSSDFEEILECIENATSIRQFHLTIPNCNPIEFPRLSHSLLTSLNLTIDLDIYQASQIVSLLNSIDSCVLLTSLEIKVEQSAESNSSEIKQCESKESDSNIEIDQEVSSLSSFINNFTLSKLNRLIRLKLTLSNMRTLSEIDLADLGKRISSASQIKNLSISISRQEILKSGFEEFFQHFTINRELKLTHFHLAFEVTLQPPSIDLFQQFFTQYDELISFELSCICLKNGMLDSILQSTSTNMNLSTISFDLKQCNSFTNGGLAPFTNLLLPARPKLEILRISSVSKQFSDQSLLALGNAIKSNQSLKEITVDLTWKFGEKPIYSFTNSITLCKQLRYIKLNLASWNEQSPVEWKAESEGKSIFECQSVNIHLDNFLDYLENEYHTGIFQSFLINLVIANKIESSATRLSIHFPSFNNKKAPLFALIDTELQKLIRLRNNLKHIEFLTLDINEKMMDIFDQLIRQNSSSLVSFEFHLSLHHSIIETLRLSSLNLLRLNVRGKYRSTQEFKLPLIQQFPNLIELTFAGWVQTDMPYVVTAQELVESSLTLYEPSYFRNMTKEQKDIAKECVSMRRSCLLSLLIFNKYIIEDLVFKPELMPIDLWIQ